MPSPAHPPPDAARQRRRFRRRLYAICVLTDFCALLVVFTTTRALSEAGGAPHVLGLLGAGFSFAAALASLLAGWGAQHCGSAPVFQMGAVALAGACLASFTLDPASAWFPAPYLGLGFALGCIYPPLIGWLNEGEDEPAGRGAGVSSRLLIFCIAWNAGMMAGQLSGGLIFSQGPRVAFGVALAVATVNLILSRVTVLGLRSWPAGSVSAPAAPIDRARAAVFQQLSWLANLGGMFGGSLVIHLLSDLAVAIQIDPEQQGLLLAGWRVVAVCTYLAMHLWGGWRFRIAWGVGSQLLGAVGLLVIAAAQSAGLLFLGLVLLGQLVGYNYFAGLFYSTAGSNSERRALAAGIHEATLAAGMAVGTILGGWLGTLFGHRVPCCLGAAIVCGLLLVQLLAWRRWVPAAQPAQSS